MKNPLFWVLLPVAGVCILVLAGIFLTVLAFMPPAVTWSALVIVVLVLAWFFFARHRTAARPVTESGLFRRQHTTEGML